ncbi:MAG TPA: DUF4199 domain-containing protein [Rhizomicrobium sp.]|nr:DUF4199 domain-containing protein [Rhizomicrobium sp.]
MNPFLRYSAIYGSLSGAIVILVLIVGLQFQHQLHFIGTEWFGYLTMLVALTFIFVGVKRYRDVEKGGVIKFFTAFAVGLGIAVMASLIYMLVWEIYLAATHYTFMDNYIDGIIRARKAAGVTGAALAKQIAQLNEMRAEYANPLYRLPMTFLEIFPVGLIVALVSAALIRNTRFLPAAR